MGGEVRTQMSLVISLHRLRTHLLCCSSPKPQIQGRLLCKLPVPQGALTASALGPPGLTSPSGWSGWRTSTSVDRAQGLGMDLTLSPAHLGAWAGEGPTL